MPDNGSKTALITGATSGIGYELAKLFARDGYSLVLIARNEQRLGELASELQAPGVVVKMLPKDLARPQSPEEIFTEVQREFPAIDVLVNHAGIGTYGLCAR